MNPLFERSEETRRLVEYLRAFDKGDSVSYRELGKQINAKVDSRFGKLIYARKLLQNEHNQVWICVRPNVGLRRLNDLEIAQRLPTFWLRGARRKLSRGGDQADVVDIATLDVDEQTKFSVSSIQRELALEALSKATRRKMEKISRGTSNDLPSFNIVEWAISLSPKKPGRETA